MKTEPIARRIANRVMLSGMVAGTLLCGAALYAVFGWLGVVGVAAYFALAGLAYLRWPHWRWLP